MSAKLQTVHVRVNDAGTGQATPARVRFSDAEGNYRAPFGHLGEFAAGVNEDVGGNLRLGDKSYCVIDGACEVALPPGPIQVEISKGFEYQPIRAEMVLGAGKLSLRFSLERWIDLRNGPPESTAGSWFSGDGRAHFLTPHAALLEGSAEDLAVVNLLALHWQPARKPPALPNILAFSGQEPALARPGHMVVVNTLNSCPLGQLSLLNCHRVVHPLSFEKINWTMADWCDQCHRKGGLVSWPDNEFWPLESAEECVGEGLADLILGKVDVLEVDLLPWHMEDDPDWYTLLNAGFRLPLLGASRKRSNATVLGCVRTYARMNPGEEFNYKNWIEAVRAGRTFVTNGPLLFFTVNGHDAGSRVELASGTQKIRVRAQARSLVPFERLEIVYNGIVVAEQEACGTPAEAYFEGELPISGSGWWAARCWGDGQILSSFCPQRAGAHTSPIYVQAEGRPMTARTGALQILGEHLDRCEKMLGQFQRQGLFPGERDRQRLADVFQNARGVLWQKLGNT